MGQIYPGQAETVGQSTINYFRMNRNFSLVLANYFHGMQKTQRKTLAIFAQYREPQVHFSLMLCKVSS